MYLVQIAFEVEESSLVHLSGVRLWFRICQAWTSLPYFAAAVILRYVRNILRDRLRTVFHAWQYIVALKKARSEEPAEVGREFDQLLPIDPDSLLMWTLVRENENCIVVRVGEGGKGRSSLIGFQNCCTDEMRERLTTVEDVDENHILHVFGRVGIVVTKVRSKALEIRLIKERCRAVLRLWQEKCGFGDQESVALDIYALQLKSRTLSW